MHKEKEVVSVDEKTLDKLIRQGCERVAELEYREFEKIGEGMEYVPSRRLQRKMKRLLRYAMRRYKHTVRTETVPRRKRHY